MEANHIKFPKEKERKGEREEEKKERIIHILNRLFLLLMFKMQND